MRTIYSVGGPLLLLLAMTAVPASVWAEELDEPAEVEAVEGFSIQDVLGDRRDEEPSRQDLSQDDVDELTALMSEAIQAERADDPGRAREFYVGAYEIYPHSNILLALGRTSAEIGDYETAVEIYERYVARNPDHEQTPQVEARIEEYQEILREQAEEEEEEGSIPFLSELTLPQPTTLGWAGAGLAVAGLGSMIIGGATASGVNKRFDALESALQDEDRGEYDRLAGEISRGQTRGKVFLYGGMVLTAGGVGLLVYDLFLSGAEPGTDQDEGLAIRVEPGLNGSLQVGVFHRF